MWASRVMQMLRRSLFVLATLVSLMWGAPLNVLAGASATTQIVPGSTAADPARRIVFTSDPYVTYNPCDPSQQLQFTSGMVAILERDSFDGYWHFVRQTSGRSTAVNLTTGDTFTVLSRSTNVIQWPDEVGDPPLAYVWRARTLFIEPGSGLGMMSRETIRLVINADGSTVFDVFDRVVTCR
jgi:hypothetical protein